MQPFVPDSLAADSDSSLIVFYTSNPLPQTVQELVAQRLTGGTSGYRCQVIVEEWPDQSSFKEVPAVVVVDATHDLRRAEAILALLREWDWPSIIIVPINRPVIERLVAEGASVVAGPQVLIGLGGVMWGILGAEPVRGLPKLDLRPTELEALRCLGNSGGSNEAIGQQLYKSAATVSQYLKAAFDKLGVNDRVGAIAVAWRLGLVP